MNEDLYLKELIIEKIINASGKETQIGWRFYFNKNGKQIDENGNIIDLFGISQDLTSINLRWGWKK